MDYWYTLEAAVPLTEYIGYFSPVKGVQEEVQADAAGGRRGRQANQGRPPDADRAVTRSRPRGAARTSTTTRT